MAREIANAQLLYVASSVPSTPDEIAEYTVIEQVANLSWDLQAEEITATDRDGSAVLAGEVTTTVSFSVNADNKTGTAGQELVWAALIAKSTLWWLITTDVTGDMQVYGDGKVTSGNANADVDTPLTGDFAIGNDGAITRAAVDA